MLKASLRDDPLSGRIHLESTFHRDFIDDMKMSIPGNMRAWDKDRRVWLISTMYEQELYEVLRRYAYTIQDLRTTGQATPAPAGTMPDDLREAFACLYLAPEAPLMVAEMVYRGMAKFLHPDKGGDPDDFQAISGAIATIRDYLKT